MGYSYWYLLTLRQHSSDYGIWDFRGWLRGCNPESGLRSGLTLGLRSGLTSGLRSGLQPRIGVGFGVAFGVATPIGVR